MVLRISIHMYNNLYTIHKMHTDNLKSHEFIILFEVIPVTFSYKFGDNSFLENTKGWSVSHGLSYHLHYLHSTWHSWSTDAASFQCLWNSRSGWLRPPCARLTWSCWLLVLAWPNTDPWGHLGSNVADRGSLLFSSSTLCNCVFQNI